MSVIENSKYHDMKMKDAAQLCQAKGELKRSFLFKKLPTEVHMMQLAKKRLGISNEEVTGPV